MSDQGHGNVGARNGALVETLAGRFVDVLNLNPADIRIEEVAHSLSMAPRWSGFVSRPYSVAEHSVYVARIVRRMCEAAMMPVDETRVIVRQALIHDAPEYVLPDMAYTIKYQPEFAFYRALDGDLWRRIAGKLEVPLEMHKFVHEVDKRMATTEKLALKSDHFPPHWAEYRKVYPEYVGDWDILDRYDVPWTSARRRFLDMWDQVKP